MELPTKTTTRWDILNSENKTSISGLIQIENKPENWTSANGSSWKLRANLVVFRCEIPLYCQSRSMGYFAADPSTDPLAIYHRWEQNQHRRNWNSRPLSAMINKWTPIDQLELLSSNAVCVQPLQGVELYHDSPFVGHNLLTVDEHGQPLLTTID